MGENEDEKQTQAGQVFENFVQASTCKGTLQAFYILTRHLDLDPLDHRNFYSKLKSKVTTWKAKALWYKLDKRGSHKEYKRGKLCTNTKVRGPRVGASCPGGVGCWWRGQGAGAASVGRLPAGVGVLRCLARLKVLFVCMCAACPDWEFPSYRGGLSNSSRALSQAEEVKACWTVSTVTTAAAPTR